MLSKHNQELKGGGWGGTVNDVWRAFRHFCVHLDSAEKQCVLNKKEKHSDLLKEDKEMPPALDTQKGGIAKEVTDLHKPEALLHPPADTSVSALYTRKILYTKVTF